MTEQRNARASSAREILDLTREYYAAAFGETRRVRARAESRVPYGGRVFDERELVNLVDSSLDFWLTYGRFSQRVRGRPRRVPRHQARATS